MWESLTTLHSLNYDYAKREKGPTIAKARVGLKGRPIHGQEVWSPQLVLWEVPN